MSAGCRLMVPSLRCRRPEVTCSVSTNHARPCALVLGLEAVGVAAAAAVRERQTLAHRRVVVPAVEAAATRTHFRRKFAPAACPPTTRNHSVFVNGTPQLSE